MFETSESKLLNEYNHFDYATNVNERKSILRYVYILADELISWMSRKQKSIAIFIMKTKYMIISSYAKEELWIAQALRDLNLIKYLENNINRVSIVEKKMHQQNLLIQLISMQLNDDNQATLTLIKNAHVHERSKHIDVVYHYVRDLYKRNLIRVDFVSSQNMMIDELTKSLSRKMFKRFVEQLNLENNKN